MKNILIVGQNIPITPIPESEKRKLWIALTTGFNIYNFTFNGAPMLLLENKQTEKYTSLQQRKIAERVENILGRPAVFYFEGLPTFERDRLVAQNVFFIVGAKFAFLPTLLANRRFANTIFPEELLPSAQYLLLLHLQSDGLNGISVKDLEKTTPYKYSTLSKAVQQLKEKNLVEVVRNGQSNNVLQFENDPKRLWMNAIPYLTSPVKKIGYLSQPIEKGIIGGISALSHYTMLAPEKNPTRVFFKTFEKEFLPYEEDQRIEIWKYPPIITENGYVDKLSLYLSLRHDKDPRVEKELEIMINEMPW